MKRDITGQAIDQAARLLIAAEQRLLDLIPLGPDQVQMTPEEVRRVLRRGSQVQREQLLTTLGVDRAVDLLLGARQAQTTLPGDEEEESAPEETRL